MVRDRAGDVHNDFRLTERENVKEDGLTDARQALRSAWPVPKDTFVTSDMPLLLTRLNRPRQP